MRIASVLTPLSHENLTLAATITTVDSANIVGEYTSITIGADGNPIISYYDITAEDLKVAKLTRTSWTPNTWES